ncbi:queuosine precursor transporter [Candidatus Woesearchaeota archaeon]|nr:queuosine precursor transporter [Candidatus Woesearchaeota archaeon]
MYNELLWIILMFVIFLFTTIAYRLFGKIGLYAWMAIALVIANLQVLKTVEMFGWVTALGNVIYGTTFLSTDILSENYGKKEAKKAVFIGFFILIAMTTIMQLTLFFIPHESDFASPSLETIFGFMPRIVIASLCAYLVSQLHDVWAFNFWKKKFEGKHLWFRNNLSTMSSQLVDNVIFTLIAFVGFFGLFGWEQVFEWSLIFQIFILSYVMKWVVAAIDTPFVYLAKWFKNRGDVE